MSQINYNGVSLGFVLTERLSLTPEMDPSGTDQLYTKFSLTVRSIFHANLAPAVSASETPTDIANRVRHLLLTPRRAFAYSNGTATAISVTDVDGDGFVRDDATGPNPVDCTFTQLYPGAWIVTYTIECRLVDCGAGAPANRGYLSLKWSDSISFSDTFTATRKRTGQIVFSQKTPKNPDAFRPLVTPAVPASFRRTNSDYTLNASGTEVRFSFTDVQLHNVPPYPAVKMSGRQVESAAMQGGPRYGQLSLRLEGAPGTNKRALFELAVYIGMTRVFAAGNIGGALGTALIGSVIGESLTDTETSVDIALNWAIDPTTGRKTGSNVELISTGGPGIGSIFGPGAAFAIGSWLGRQFSGPPAPQVPNQQGQNKAAMNNVAQWLGQPIPGSDPTLGIAPPTQGLADRVKLVAAALNDPCASGTQLLPSLTENTLVGTADDGSTTTVNVVPAFADDQSGLYGQADGRPDVYESYTLTSHYTAISGRAVLTSTKVGEKSAAVKLHNERLLLQVDWSASRRGAPPVLPNPNPTGTSENAIFLNGTVSSQEIQVGADGVTPYYQVSGVYYYEFLDPCSVSIVAPIPPYLEGSIGQQARIVAGVASDAILFGAANAGGQVSIFCGVGMEYVGFAELTTGGPPPFIGP